MTVQSWKRISWERRNCRPRRLRYTGVVTPVLNATGSTRPQREVFLGKVGKEGEHIHHLTIRCLVGHRIISPIFVWACCLLDVTTVLRTTRELPTAALLWHSKPVIWEQTTVSRPPPCERRRPVVLHGSMNIRRQLVGIAPLCYALAGNSLCLVGCQNESPPACEEKRRLLPNLDSPATPSGLTGQGLLDLAVGSYPVLLSSSGPPHQFTKLVPEFKETEGIIKISYAQGELHQVDSSPVNCTGEECEAIKKECSNRTEVQVVVEFQTTNGAFSERWPAVLSASKTGPHPDAEPIYQAKAFLTFLPNRMAGSLRASFDPPQNRPCIKLVDQSFSVELLFNQKTLTSGVLKALTRTECDGYQVTNSTDLYHIHAKGTFGGFR